MQSVRWYIKSFVYHMQFNPYHKPQSWVISPFYRLKNKDKGLIVR